MTIKKKIKLPLTDSEKLCLRKRKIKVLEILNFTPDELEIILDVSPLRAKVLRALVDFQTVPSVGIKFAEDLVFMEFYSIEELKNEDGALLTDKYEKKKGYWIDPCLEDQFRLIIYYANTYDTTKNWWDFTNDRKIYRNTIGYPNNRPTKAWFETLDAKD